MKMKRVSQIRISKILLAYWPTWQPASAALERALKQELAHFLRTRSDLVRRRRQRSRGHSRPWRGYESPTAPTSTTLEEYDKENNSLMLQAVRPGSVDQYSNGTGKYDTYLSGENIDPLVLFHTILLTIDYL